MTRRTTSKIGLMCMSFQMMNNNIVLWAIHFNPFPSVPLHADCYSATLHLSQSFLLPPEVARSNLYVEAYIPLVLVSAKSNKENTESL